ncbi:MAG: LLM class F420-dependent oxidoreductase [Pseudomonadota bacterium]|jgi:probable F420-dependent oxidoreductase|nr:LLM class F420-dependent oxidoreductase [Pseudomonadota bacterium]
MKVGTSVPLPAYTIDPAFMAKKAEDLGFDSIWYAEHPAVPVHSESSFPATGGDIPWTYSHFTEPYIALARASAVTSTIKLGTGITLVPERHPLLLAKEVAALDLYSGGRFQFGIGTGWLREETEIFGGDFPRRWTQTREALDVMKLCWTEEEAEYHGKYYDFPPVRSFPKPTQQPYPPILIGGMAPNVLKRIVAHADGWLPNRVSAQDIENSRKKLEALCAEAGRDPSSIEIVIYGQAPDKAELQSLVDAGADSVVVKPEWVETEAEMGEQLERMAGLVL